MKLVVAWDTLTPVMFYYYITMYIFLQHYIETLRQQPTHSICSVSPGGEAHSSPYDLALQGSTSHPQPSGQL